MSRGVIISINPISRLNLGINSLKLFQFCYDSEQIQINTVDTLPKLNMCKTYMRPARVIRASYGCLGSVLIGNAILIIPSLLKRQKQFEVIMYLEGISLGVYDIY